MMHGPINIKLIWSLNLNFSQNLFEIIAHMISISGKIIQ